MPPHRETLSDRQLLDLVQQKSPGELSVGEARLILGRVQRSDEVRDFFAGQLRWQQYFADLESRCDTFSCAAQSAKLSKWRPAVLATATIVLGLVAVAATIYLTLASPAEVSQIHSTQRNQPVSPSRDSPSDAVEPVDPLVESSTGGESISPAVRHELQVVPPSLPTGGTATSDGDALIPAEWPIRGQLPESARSPDDLRAEVLRLFEERRWSDLHVLCRQNHGQGDTERSGLLEWAEAIAVRRGGLVAPESILRQRVSWLPQLIEGFDRNVYQQAAELRALLGVGDLAAACDYVLGLRYEDAVGLFPAEFDSDLTIGMLAFVAGIHEEHPEFVLHLQQRHTELAELRVVAAIDDQDLMQLSWLSTLFADGPAAEQAHLWLGHRALRRRWLEEAELHFQELPIAAQAKGLAAIATLRRQNGKRGDDRTVNNTKDSLGDRYVQATVIDEPWGRFPMKTPVSAIAEKNLDWQARQLSSHMVGERLVLSNRFQLMELDVPTAKTIWQNGPIPGRIGLAQDWPLTPMAPLVLERSVVARLMYGEAPTMFGFDRTNGARMWTSQPRPGVSLISDPWWNRSQLCSLTAQIDEQEQLSVRQTTWDSDTGTVWYDRDLIQIRGTWQLKRVCQVAHHGMLTVATFGGVTICFDAESRIRWLRDDPRVPADADDEWLRQVAVPPVFYEGNVYLSQPGVWSVRCVDLQTGKLQWSQFFSDLVQIVGVEKDVVVVDRFDRISGLDAANGEVLWSTDLPGTQAVCVNRAPQPMIVVAVVDTSSRLLVVDLESGQIRDDVMPPDLPPDCSRIGPLIPHDGGCWFLTGDDQQVRRTLWKWDM